MNMGRMPARGNALGWEVFVMAKWAGLMATAAMLALTACGDKAADGGAKADNSEPVKRQPGSWSSKITILKLDAPGMSGGEKEQMQAMMDMVGNVSVCLTPEAVAQEDVTQQIEAMGSQGGDCKFSKKDFSGNNISFAATCKTGDGGSANISGEGTSGATSQDITITTAGLKPDGSAAGEMVMRVTATRSGECKPGDITPPPTPKTQDAK
jgi:hypothetical protein